MSDMPPIEKGVPIPEVQKYRLKYPFLMMEVGDSFVAPLRKMGSIRNCITHYTKTRKMQFITRRTTNGIRIWRTK